MLIKTDLICDIGCVRQKNEDIILLDGELYRDKSAQSKYELTPEVRFVAIVADGMGGHKGGDVASEIVAQQFNEFVYNLPGKLSQEEVISRIKDWTQATHQLLVHLSSVNRELEEMGSTFCGMLFYEKMIFILNIGDSRIYRFRDGIFKQLSTDHSLRQLTGDMSIPNNIIYNSFGGNDDVYIDVKNISGQVFENDIFLICSDGLADMVSDTEIEKTLIETVSAQKLVDKAKQAGGKDNISVIIMQICQSTNSGL